MKKNESKIFTGDLFREMIISGANDLFNHYPEIDKLNVFPVPDGDTGTNMNLTITSGSKEVANIRNNNLGEVVKIFSRGLLMGARGNSGVILSQIFRGFSSALVGKEVATIEEFGAAWTKGAEIAYKAVMKPQEGTILTVVREAAEKLNKDIKKCANITDAMNTLLKAAEVSLQHTPELLPVLKEVGVVDSGGAGLCKIFEGMYKVLIGEPVERNVISVSSNSIHQTIDKKDQEFKYSVDLIFRIVPGKKEMNAEFFSKGLESLGSNCSFIQKGDLVKLSIITRKPGQILNSTQNYGEFIEINIKKDGDTEVVDHTIFTAETPKKELGIIATSVGEGLDKLFKSLNVDYIVSGGQTMNPSTEDFVEAIKKINANNVIILPNNKNIVMAAQQACEVIEGVNAKVVPSKTINQGLVACMMFNPDASFDEIVKDMNSAIKSVKSGSVTFSIKDTEIDGVKIKKDHFMGIGEGKIKCCLENKHECAKSLLKELIDEDSSIVTVIYGEDVKEEEAKNLADFIEDMFSIEVEVHEGNQPVYSYLIGVE